MIIEDLQKRLKIDRELAYLLIVVGDYVKGNKSEEPINVDWGELLQYASFQRIDSIVYLQCKSFIPNKYYSQFRFRDLHIKTKYHENITQVKTIDKLFNDNKIEYLLFKGTGISKYYPDPYVRYSVDLDIVVDKKDMDRVYDVLSKAGYKRTSILPEQQYEKDNTCIEVHPEIIYGEEFCSDDEYNFFNRYTEYATNNNETFHKRLDINFEFVYLLWHLNKHIVCNFIKIKMILDLCFLYKYADLDFSRVNTMLKESGFDKFAYRLFKLCEIWFDFSFDEFNCSDVECDDDFIERITRLLIAKIVDNKKEICWDGLYSYSNYKECSKFKAFWLKLFPPLKVVRLDHRYRFVNKSKLLLPVAWIYRLYCGIRYENVLNPKVISNKTSHLSETINDRNKMHN